MEGKFGLKLVRSGGDTGCWDTVNVVSFQASQTKCCLKNRSCNRNIFDISVLYSSLLTK
jgi:hypothetical protein